MLVERNKDVGRIYSREGKICIWKTESEGISMRVEVRKVGIQGVCSFELSIQSGDNYFASGMASASATIGRSLLGSFDPPETDINKMDSIFLVNSSLR